MAALYQKYLNADYDEIADLTEGELKSALRSAVQGANYRIRQLERFGMESYSEAYQAVKHGTKAGQGQFTAAGKDTKMRMRKELNRALSFLRSRTSELSGAEERRQWYLQRFGTDDPEELKAFFNRYHELIDADPHGGDSGPLARYLGNVGSTRIQDIVWNMRHESTDSIKEAVAVEYPSAIARLRGAE